MHAVAWTTTSQLDLFWPANFRPIPQQKDSAWDAHTAKSVSCAIAHTGLDYSIANMGSAIYFSPNTHQQQHFATSFNAFRHMAGPGNNPVQVYRT
jgi:hypothetical protein